MIDRWLKERAKRRYGLTEEYLVERPFDAGDITGLDQRIRAIRRGDGHTVIRWTIRKAWGPVLSVDVRVEHAIAYAREWEDAAERAYDADPHQDWSVDPIRDSWSGGPVDPRWFDVVSEL
jgi:hypothetical protein